MSNILTQILYIFTILASFLLGLTVFIHNSRKKGNKLFFLLSTSIALWIFTVFLYYTISAQPWLLWIGRTNFAVAVMVPLIGFIFIREYPGKLIEIPAFLARTIYTLSIILFFLCFTPLIDINEVATGINRTTTFGPLYVFLLIEIVVVCFICVGILILKWRRSSGIARMQLLYFSLGFISLFVIAIICNGILPFIFNDYNFQSIGFISSVGFIGFTSYTIIRHRFLDVSRFTAFILEKVSEALLYICVFAGIAIFIGSVFFFHHINIPFILIAVTVCVFIQLIFQPLGKIVNKLFKLVFYRKLYLKEKILLEIQELAKSLVDVDKFVAESLAILKKYMEINDLDYVDMLDQKIKNKTIQDPFMIDLLSQLQRPVVREELSEGDVKEFLTLHKIGLIFPLQISKNNRRFLIAGDKINKFPYFWYDFQTLHYISDPLVIAIQNMQYLSEIQEYNSHLAIDIRKATKELRHANTRLRHADKLKDEFISIASHELKTPTTAMQGFLWLVLQKDKDLSLYSREKLEKVARLTQQLTILVNDMLDVSKIESGRISLHPEHFDVGLLVEEIKGELDMQAIQKDIELSVKNSKPFVVWADKTRVHQIASNLLTNALKYTQKGGKIRVTFKKDDGKIKIAIKDTGIGIRQEDLPKLFTKFGKLEDGNSVSSHLPGTGLGLYITKNFVELSGGEIDVNSTYGKGSTFTFSLPVEEML